VELSCLATEAHGTRRRGREKEPKRELPSERRQGRRGHVTRSGGDRV
jgi:hypothetical protein